ncbi:MAG TPA: metallopeptidase TldD-related protein [Myxococcaceae bacterium]
MRTLRPAAACLALLAASAPRSAEGPAPADSRDALLSALAAQLESARARWMAAEGTGPRPYYVAYRVADDTEYTDSAGFGALQDVVVANGPIGDRKRWLDVSVRVGSPELDSTHRLRDSFDFDWLDSRDDGLLPIEDDAGALQLAIWRVTDGAYRGALRRYLKVKANREVKVEEEDRAADFSDEKLAVSVGPPAAAAVDRALWRERLRRASARFRDHPIILVGEVSLHVRTGTRYFADTAGSRIRQAHFAARVAISGQARADDGNEVELFDSIEADRPDGLPDEATVAARVEALAKRLEAVRAAPPVDAYSGPAIVAGRAAAVMFHEIFGHRIEGHRQKDEDDGHTFTKKLGQRIVPDFISVADDPTQRAWGPTPLSGAYAFDDEGVPAQRVPLVERGVLKGFLMGRSPIRGFPHSNGHGRAQAGRGPVARQGNLLVQSSQELAPAALRERLLAELRKRNKPYGLIIDEIAGGFTNTQAGAMPQAFKVIPRVVTRVYADGRKDELVRGVDLVGTPLSTFEQILATGSDSGVFNGVCGAESGWVPVSAVAPSLLVGEIEVERKGKGHDRPPLLPPPLFPSMAWGPPKPAAPPAPPSATRDQP